MALNHRAKSCHFGHERSCGIGPPPSSLPLLYPSPDPATQQIVPYLFQASRGLGGMAATMPFVQEASKRIFDMMQGTDAGSAASNRDQGASSRNPMVREYRDVRPAKKRFSFTAEDGSTSRKSSQSYSNPPLDFDNKRKASGSNRQGTPTSSTDSAMERIARFMGADFGGGDPNTRSKQRSR